MKKISVIVALAILGAGGVWLYFSAAGKAEQAVVQGAADIAVQRGDIESLVTAQGTLEPKDYVDVGAQVSGEIVKMHVEIGDKVKAGDLIAEIDPDVYEAQVKASEAKLKTLAAHEAQQKALIMQAQWKYDRNQKLFKQKAVSEEVLQDAQITLDVAKANLLALEAQIEEAQSSLEGDQTNLNYTKIYAPIDGTVVDEAVQEGQTINANQTTPTIVQIANLDTMTVRAQVAEADVMKLREGMEMYFTTLGSGARRWTGQVRQILPTPEEINDVVLYNVLVDVDNTDRGLMSGMTTQMFFVTASAKDALIVPVAALGKNIAAQDTEKAQAFEIRVKKDKGEEIRTVLIGMQDRVQAVVESGLQEGEIVLSPFKEAKAKDAAQRMGMPRL